MLTVISFVVDPYAANARALSPRQRRRDSLLSSRGVGRLGCDAAGDGADGGLHSGILQEELRSRCGFTAVGRVDCFDPLGSVADGGYAESRG